MKRRRFLHLTAAAPLAAALPAPRPAAAPSPPDFFRPEEAQSIGCAYRRLHPGEDDAALLRVLLPPIDTGARQIRDDFAAGRTCCLDGWVISHTEARQCALFSLLSGTA